MKLLNMGRGKKLGSPVVYDRLLIRQRTWDSEARTWKRSWVEYGILPTTGILVGKRLLRNGLLDPLEDQSGDIQTIWKTTEYVHAGLVASNLKDDPTRVPWYCIKPLYG
jgi:hypothetical protein